MTANEAPELKAISELKLKPTTKLNKSSSNINGNHHEQAQTNTETSLVSLYVKNSNINIYTLDY